MKNKAKSRMVQRGLANIFRGLNYYDVLGKATHERHKLKAHPFGLDVRPVDDEPVILPAWTRTGITFLSHPGYTDSSVKAMIAHIRWNLADNETREAGPYRMRIIMVPSSDIPHSGHQVFFEITTAMGTFMCSGCRDDSGAGREGMQTLESIFELLSLVFEIPIERVIVPCSKAGSMLSALRHEVNIDEYNKHR